MSEGKGWREVSEAGVRFQWRIEAGELHGCIEAQTRGWIAVGFNARTELDGARLVMARLVSGQAHAEVHIAKPPHHMLRLNPDGTQRVKNVIGNYEDARTRVCFQMSLAPVDTEDVALRAGQPTHLVLAWSHSADFEHHSAQRGSRNVKL
jgi:DOMON domain